MRKKSPGQSVCDGIICYSSVDWWYHPRGHSDCQIMTRLAREIPVLWINSIGMRLPWPGKSKLVFHRYFRKLSSTFQGLRQDPSGLWIYSPFFVPYYTVNWLKFNGRLLAAQITWLSRMLGIGKPSIWVTLPTAAPAVTQGRWKTVVFNRCDEFSAFPEANRDVIKHMERLLFKFSDQVVYVNHALMEREKDQVNQATYLGHGVDYDHFASTEYHRGELPQSIHNLPRPIVGFYGELVDYKIDLELMIKIAGFIHPGTLLIIGLEVMDLTPLLAETNVVYLGPIPYRDLPLYAGQFDVALLPWKHNRWIENCNPIKLKEYLALGLPIVTVRFPELKPFEGLVYPADTPEEFLAALRLALAEHNPTAVASRRAAVADSSWDKVARQAGLLLGLPMKENGDSH